MSSQNGSEKSSSFIWREIGISLQFVRNIGFVPYSLESFPLIGVQFRLVGYCCTPFWVAAG